MPSACAQPGIAANGNMNPDKRMVGRMVKNDNCIACICERDMVDTKNPIARLTTI